MAIKAILFDLGGVIVPYDYSRFFTSLSQLSALPGEQVERLFEAQRPHYLALELGRMSAEDFAASLGQALGVALSLRDFETAWNSIFLMPPLLAPELLRGLASRYTLVAVSDTNPIHFPFVRSQYAAVLDCFHHFALSYQLGRLKPDREIFLQAAAMAQCLPSECLFIDDRIANAEGARQTGMTAIHADGSAEVAQLLAAYL